MGKVRAKDRGRRRRPQPTGLPSVKESIQQDKLEPTGSRRIAILDQLSHSSYEEREWACRSLSHLILEEDSLKSLMRARLVRKTTPLLLDQVYSVREAAAGLLRNLSAIASEEICDDVVKEDVMTPLSAMIRDCLTRLEQMRKGSEEEEKEEEKGSAMMEGESRDDSMKAKKARHRKRLKVDIEQQQLTGVLEQGLHLLWNVSERSQLVVEVFNKESLLPVILSILQPSLHPSSVVLVAAQLLQTVTEDNLSAVEELSSSPQHLSLLESLLQEPPMETSTDSSSRLLLKTCIAGVFQNLLTGLDPPVRTQTLRGVLAHLSSVLDIDVAAMIVMVTGKGEGEREGEDTKEGADKNSSTDNAMANGEEPTNLTDTSVKSASKQEKSVETTLSALQQALEIIANICYVESDEDCEWEDELGEMEEMFGERDEVADMEIDTQTQVPNGHGECDPDLLAIAELGLHEKVWKLCCVDISLNEQEPSLQNSLSLVQSRSLVALQNLLSVLPLDRWGGASGLSTIWSSLFSHCRQCSDVEALTGALLVLAEKLPETEASCISMEQVQLLSSVGLTYDKPAVRANTVAILGLLGRLVLKTKLEIRESVLQLVGTTLRDSIANDISLWVVAQALDSSFDLFGDDLCPPSLFASLSFLPVLSQISASYKARLRVEKKILGEQLGLVQNTQANLPRFIKYMREKCRT